jgi:hypothetical protein
LKVRIVHRVAIATEPRDRPLQVLERRRQDGGTRVVRWAFDRFDRLRIDSFPSSLAVRNPDVAERPRAVLDSLQVLAT